MTPFLFLLACVGALPPTGNADFLPDRPRPPPRKPKPPQPSRFASMEEFMEQGGPEPEGPLAVPGTRSSVWHRSSTLDEERQKKRKAHNQAQKKARRKNRP